MNKLVIHRWAHVPAFDYIGLFDMNDVEILTEKDIKVGDIYNIEVPDFGFIEVKVDRVVKTLDSEAVVFHSDIQKPLRIIDEDIAEKVLKEMEWKKLSGLIERRERERAVREEESDRIYKEIEQPRLAWYQKLFKNTK